MKKILFCFLSLFVLSANAQQPRVPAFMDGNYLLFRSDTIIVAYYWDKDNFQEGQANNDYNYSLELCIKNLTKDSLKFNFTIQTFETKPVKLTEIKEEKLKFAFCEPKNSVCHAFNTSSGNIVDFKFKDFILRFPSGVVIDIADEVNNFKNDPVKRFVRFN